MATEGSVVQGVAYGQDGQVSVPYFVPESFNVQLILFWFVCCAIVLEPVDCAFDPWPVHSCILILNVA